MDIQLINLCEYGYGQQTKYQFKNGKFCCSSNVPKCPYIKRKRQEKYKNYFNNESSLEKQKRIDNHKGIWDQNKRKAAAIKSKNQWTDDDHKQPQKLEPFFTLDPDLAWSICKKCHFKYGHKDECSIGNLIREVK